MLDTIDGIVYDSYDFTQEEDLIAESDHLLNLKNFSRTNQWDDLMFYARRDVQPLSRFTGTTIFFSETRQNSVRVYDKRRQDQKKANELARELKKPEKIIQLKEWAFFEENPDPENTSYLEKLKTPDSDSSKVLEIVCRMSDSKELIHHPQRFVEKVSNLINEEWPGRVILLVHVQIRSRNHAKILARFQDPAFRRVFSNLIIVPSETTLDESKDLLQKIYPNAIHHRFLC
jgi:hypothetical protein